MTLTKLMQHSAMALGLTAMGAATLPAHAASGDATAEWKKKQTEANAGLEAEQSAEELEAPEADAGAVTARDLGADFEADAEVNASDVGADVESDAETTLQAQSAAPAEVTPEAETTAEADAEVSDGLPKADATADATADAEGTATTEAESQQTAEAGESGEFTDETLESFLDAATKVAALRQTFEVRMSTAEDDAARRTLVQEAGEKMRDAVATTDGISVEEYVRIGKAVQSDPELNERISTMLRERIPGEAGASEKSDG